jgi:hypothetical protein
MTTRRLLQVIACCAALAVSPVIWAQAGATEVSMGYAGLPGKAVPPTNNGVQVSDTVLMHTGVGVEAGYDTNVFYGDKATAVGSGIVRVVPYLEFTNTTRAGVIPAGVFFDLDFAATFRQYLSSDPQPKMPDKKISDQREFLPAASGTVEFSSGQTVSLTINDVFTRMEEAPYMNSMGTTGPLTRYLNAASAQVRWAPGGGRAQGILRYDNTFDAFATDSGLSFANSISHTASLDLSWKWLPKTAIFARVAQGYVSYLNGPGTGPEEQKSVSYPFHAALGLRGLVTQKTSVNIWVGYSNGFYASGPNPEGVLGHLNANVELSVRPTVLNTLGVAYRQDFQNSVLGNFYYVEALSAWFQQQLAGRFALLASGRYEHRTFQFTTSQRTDNFFQVGASADYRAKSWTYVGVGYALMHNDANMPPTPGTPLGATYTKQQIFARLGVTY